MSDAEIGARINAALNFLQTATEDKVREHCLWLLRQMMKNLRPEDLSTPTLMSLVAILVPEHSGVLAGREPSGVPGAVLRLVSESNGAAG